MDTSFSFFSQFYKNRTVSPKADNELLTAKPSKPALQQQSVMLK